MSAKLQKPSVVIDTFYDQTLRVLFYLLFFLTPLVMWTKTSEVFEFNKMLFVYVITTLVSATWILKSLSQKKFSWAKTPLDLPILFFFFSQVISTVLSIDRHTSLWGYYSRFHGGLMSTLSYLLLYYAFITHFYQNQKFLTRLLYTILSSAILVSVYGVLEHFGIDKHIWVQDVQNRVFSTLGQPNWLSAYLLALLPLSLLGFSNSKEKLYKWFYALTSFLLFLTILYTRSRSGIGATFIILFLYFVFDFFNLLHTHTTSNLKITFISISLIALTVFFVGTPWTPSPKTINQSLTYGGPSWDWGEKYLQKLHLTSAFKPVQVQLLSDSQKLQYESAQKGIRLGGSDSMEIRKVVWTGAIDLIKRYPLFGPGVETFGYTYYWVRPASHNLLSEWDFLYNKAHNEFLNFAANSGLVGLFSYLTLIIAIFTLTYQSHQQKNPLALPLALGTLSILITNYYGFSVVCVALFFFLFPAFLLLTDHRVEIKQPNFNLDYIVGAIVTVCTTLYLLSGINHYWQADKAFNNGKNALLYGQTQYLMVAIDSLTKSIQINPHEPLYPSQLAEAQAQAAMIINQQLLALPASASAEQKAQYQAGRDDYLNQALTNAQKSVTTNPYQLNFLKSQAKVALYLSTIDLNYAQVGLRALLQASEKAPTDAKLLYNIGLIYQNLNQPDNAKRAFQQAVELKSDYAEAIEKLAYFTSTPSGQKK